MSKMFGGVPVGNLARPTWLPAEARLMGREVDKDAYLLVWGWQHDGTWFYVAAASA